MTATYKIASEDDAFELLAKLVEGAPLGEGFSVRFERWPRFVITVQGEDFDGTIPTRIMPTLLELQRQVHVLYARTTYGTDNLRRLTKEDKEGLELLVRVERGSSFFETLLNEPLFKTLQAASSKMSPEQITAVLIVFGLFATSLIGWKMWLSHRSHERDLEHQLKMSRLENDRMELIRKAGERFPETREAAAAMDPVRNELLTRLKPSDRLDVHPEALPAGTTPVQITGAEAAPLVRAQREAPAERLLTDEFLLLAADFSKPGIVRVELRRLSDGYAFRADVPAGVLDPDQEHALRDKGWDRMSMNMSVYVRELRGQFTGAKVVAVNAAT